MCGTCVKKAKHACLFYELVTGLYMLDGFEKVIFNSVVVLLMSTTGYYCFSILKDLM